MPTNFFINKLRGKRVVILGGTSGIGFAVAQGCLELGASVIVASSSQTHVDDAIIRLSESGDASRISGYTINLRRGTEDLEGIEARMSHFLLEQVKDPFDHIVFTAGDVFSVSDIGKADLNKVSRDMDVRYWAPFAACKILQNSGLLREGGSITFTGGHIAVRPEKGTAGAAGVSGLPALARLVSLEMAPIRCNVVIPGPVHTEILDAFGMGTPEYLETLKAKTTIGRIAGPHDTAEAYLYCMRDGSLTGQTIVTDSGSLLL